MLTKFIAAARPLRHALFPSQALRRFATETAISDKQVTQRVKDIRYVVELSAKDAIQENLKDFTRVSDVEKIAHTLKTELQASHKELQASHNTLKVELQASREISAAGIRAIKESSQAEIRAIKEGSQVEIRAVKEGSEAGIRAIKEGSEAGIRAIKESTTAQIQATREASTTELKAIRETFAGQTKSFQDTAGFYREERNSMRWFIGLTGAMATSVMLYTARTSPGRDHQPVYAEKQHPPHDNPRETALEKPPGPA